LRAQMITLITPGNTPLRMYRCQETRAFAGPTYGKEFRLASRAWSRPRAFAIATSNHAAPAELES
jgi:hypothetical protein